MLQPAESAVAIQLVLAPLTSGSAETGLAALGAVPEFSSMLRAIGQRCGEALKEYQKLREICDPLAASLPLAEIDPAHVERIVLLGDAARSQFAAVIDFRPAYEKAASDWFDVCASSMRNRGVIPQEDEPWPGSHRLLCEGRDDAWVAWRGRQFVTGTHTELLQLRPTAVAQEGFSLHVEVPAAVTAQTGRPRTVALDRAIAEGIGFTVAPTAFWDLQGTSGGYRQGLGWRGARANPVRARSLEAAPVLPRLEGLFMALRANLDPAWLLAVLDAYSEVFHLTVDPLRAALQQADGSLSLSVGAPPAGSFYPRVALAFRLSDPLAQMAQWKREADAAPDGSLQSKEVDGLSIVMWTIPGAPASLRPTLGVVDGALLVTECPATFRVVRKAWGKGGDVFSESGAVPCAAPQGSTVLGEVWFDCETIYERSAKIWGTNLLAMALMPDIGDPAYQAAAVLEPRDLPDARDVAATLGRGSAVLYCSKDEVGIKVEAPALGPVQSGLLAVGTVLVPRVLAMGIESQLREQRALASEARARRLGAALVRYRSEHDGRLPGEVGDLVGLLTVGDKEPLRAPHDPVALPGESVLADGRKVEMACSFQVAPEGMTAAPALPALPGRRPAVGQPLPSRKVRPVFAFCGAAYRGHHMVILNDGEVVWIRSEDLLEAVLPKKR